MPCLQWAAGEKMCHLPRRRAARRGRGGRQAARCAGERAMEYALRKNGDNSQNQRREWRLPGYLHDAFCHSPPVVRVKTRDAHSVWSMASFVVVIYDGVCIVVVTVVTRRVYGESLSCTTRKRGTPAARLSRGRWRSQSRQRGASALWISLLHHHYLLRKRNRLLLHHHFLRRVNIDHSSLFFNRWGMS